MNDLQAIGIAEQSKQGRSYMYTCETGAECEAEHRYRFDLACVASLTDGERVDRDEGEQDEAVVEAVIEAEQAFPDETETIEIDPDHKQGYVIIRHDSIKIIRSRR